MILSKCRNPPPGSSQCDTSRNGGHQLEDRNGQAATQMHVVPHSPLVTNDTGPRTSASAGDLRPWRLPLSSPESDRWCTRALTSCDAPPSARPSIWNRRYSGRINETEQSENEENGSCWAQISDRRSCRGRQRPLVGRVWADRSKFFK